MPQMPAVSPTQERSDSAAQVEAWRLHVLLQAGYPLSVAERLARSGADLHLAVEMLGRGCAPAVAARILV